jgi:hypothetical protein
MRATNVRWNMMRTLFRQAHRRGAGASPATPSGAKLFFLRLVRVAIPLFAVVLVPMAYYAAVAKLPFSAYNCGSFAQLDGEIGWVLRPGADTCLGGRGVFAAAPWFEAPVHTDRNGFRAALSGGATPVGGLMVVGDSYAFGYGVAFEQSYAGQLESLAGLPVVDVASPAYSSARAMLWARRWLGRLQPRAIVYLDNGMWQRAACRGTRRPSAILKPGYWHPPDAAAAELVTPPPGRVEAWAKWGVLPGGAVGAGETGWD